MTLLTLDIHTQHGEQIIRLPAEWQVDDDKVYVRKVGETLYLIPYHRPWQVLFDSWDQFSDDFMTARTQPDAQSRTALGE
ncbi:MAG: hypothetical protein OHK0039_48430 [Bacteroidia bacterium]